MKKLILILIILIATSCQSDKALAKASKSYLDTAGTEYESYVMADPKLDAISKRVRIRNAKAFRKAVTEANR